MSDITARLARALAGRYRPERELGQGGMATVYLAHDLRYDRPVAIKVLHPELAHTLGPERFMREISITAQLDHPHILSLLDSGVIEPQPTTHESRLLFYVMPYVAGESLRDRLNRETQLPIDEALRLFGEIADALDHAHRQGFVHRDLKPENVLLQDGHARVADFGLARAMSAVGSDKLTQTGLALGTPSYMSPEQAAGQNNIDARSDIYALGCLLYEMLAGNPPFQGPTVQAIMARHAVDPVPALRTVRGTVPASVEAAITKALAKVPADRFTSAAQFVEAFSKPVPPVALAGVGRRVHSAWIAGAAIALALSVLAGWLFTRSRRPQVEPSARVIAVLPFFSSSDTALARLGRDLTVTISANLDGVGGIRTTDPHVVLSRADDSRSGQWNPNRLALGKSLGAGSVLVGDIARVGPDVRLDLQLLSTRGDSEPLARVFINGSPDSISALTDSVTWALLRQVWRRGEPPSPSYANVTTRSVLSLRAFLDGERLTAAGNWAEAAHAYAAAIKADSSFWLAGWRYDGTQAWGSDAEPNPVLEHGYQSHLSAFGPRDRMLIEAEMSQSVSDSEHLARFRAVTEQFPLDWPAWFEYADHLQHQGGLIGYTNAEDRAALRRTVDLNPKLVPMWEHLAQASMGHDSAQNALAVRSLIALGRIRTISEDLGFDASLFYRVVSANGQFSSILLDSLVSGIAGSKVPGVHFWGAVFLHDFGFPAAQVEMNRRLLAFDPHGPYVGPIWKRTAYAWAARGAWDSTLVAWDRYAAASPDKASAVDIFQLAVAGAWLGGLDTARAVERRAAAVKYLGGLAPGDSTEARDARAAMAWSDGMLAVLRRDPRGLAAARVSAQQSGDKGAEFVDRSLAAFESELAGAKRAAADSLAALDLAATEGQLFGPRDPYARSVDHLMGSRLLLQLGDTTRAARLLTWHEVDMAWYWTSWAPFVPLAYYELARIEEAQGRNDEARDHYQQFLRRYDSPVPAHKHLVDEANAALRRLAGQNDASATR